MTKQQVEEHGDYAEGSVIGKAYRSNILTIEINKEARSSNGGWGLIRLPKIQIDIYHINMIIFSESNIEAIDAHSNRQYIAWKSWLKNDR